MGLWYRVFGRIDFEVSPDSIRGHLAATRAGIDAEFHFEEGVWVAAEIRFAVTTPLHLERFFANEEGIRAELNSWAAFLETCDYAPNHADLMERVIQTRQLFTVRRPIDHADEVLVENLCTRLCRYLATATGGIWQADDEGFYAADGSLLLQEY